MSGSALVAVTAGCYPDFIFDDFADKTVFRRDGVPADLADAFLRAGLRPDA